MKSSHYLFSLVVFITVFSCGKEAENSNENDKNKEEKICVTAGSADITETSVSLSGFANLTNDMTGGVIIGFVISEEATPMLNNGMIVSTKELNPDNSFSVVVTNLDPATQYYYRAFVRRNDVYMYGETLSFKTLSFTLHLSQSSVTVSYEGGKVHLDISSPVVPSFEVSEWPNWIDRYIDSYSENVLSITFDILPNKSSEPRTVIFIIKAKGALKDESFTITQEGYEEDQDHIELIRRSDWSARYVARENRVNDDGSVDKVEHFQFTYLGKDYYIVRHILPDDLYSVYNNDLAAFFTYEAEKLIDDVGVNFWQHSDKVFNSKITDVYFNRIRSGTWKAFLIELDAQGKVTGNYVETGYTIKEEAPTEAFCKWFGTWRASNGLVSYDLTISSIDNNFIYRIDGWERGPSVSFQMDQEYIEGVFRAQDGCLYIPSQIIGTYDDGYWGKVDEVFVGNIFDSHGLTIITDEGVDLAVMVPQGDGCELQPMDVTINTENGRFTAKFHSIQYYMRDYKNGDWHPYNTNVAELPLTMTRLAGTRASSVSTTKQRTATKASIHHSQPSNWEIHAY